MIPLIVVAILVTGVSVACESVQSAPVPRDGDCLRDLRGYGDALIDDPADQTLYGYTVVDCDSEAAEYRVDDVIAPVGYSEPRPCPEEYVEARVTRSSEPALTTWNLCLVRLKPS